MYSQIKHPEYDSMSFSEIDSIREKISSGELILVVKKTKSMAYLNQMFLTYRLILKWIQNLSIIGFIFSFICLFFNWKISIILFVVAIISGIIVSVKAPKYIFENCKKDRAFLKFALAVGLVETRTP